MSPGRRSAQRRQGGAAAATGALLTLRRAGRRHEPGGRRIHRRSCRPGRGRNQFAAGWPWRKLDQPPGAGASSSHSGREGDRVDTRRGLGTRAPAPRHPGVAIPPRRTASRASGLGVRTDRGGTVSRAGAWNSDGVAEPGTEVSRHVRARVEPGAQGPANHVRCASPHSLDTAAVTVLPRGFVEARGITSSLHAANEHGGGRRRREGRARGGEKLRRQQLGQNVPVLVRRPRAAAVSGTGLAGASGASSAGEGDRTDIGNSPQRSAG